MISVIIPAYNCESTLERAVRSLLCQTYSGFEVIIIDDGSTDSTNQVACEIASQDNRIRLFTTENRGAGKARNRGIDEARGEYLCFVDSDDYVHPEFLEMLSRQAAEGILSCVGVSDDEAKGSLLEEIPGGVYTVGEKLTGDLLIGQLKNGIYYSVCNKLFHAALLRKHSIRFFGGYKVGEDLLFTLRYLCYCEKVVVVNRALYYYCYNVSSAIHSVANNLLPAYDRLLDKLAEFSENGFSVTENDLQYWAFDSLIVALCNGYPLSLAPEEFKRYCRDTLFHSSMYRCAMRYRGHEGFQRCVLRFVLRHKNIRLLRGLLQSKRGLSKTS